MSAREDQTTEATAGAAFRQCASPPRTRAQSSVLSIRLTAEERAQLERDAAGRTLSAYARERLGKSWGGSRRGRSGPSKAHQALGRALGALGKSPQTGTLKGVLRACEEGAIVLNVDAEDALRRTCDRIDAMRADLIQALGLKVE